MLPLLTTIDRGVGKANNETLALRSVDVSRALPLAAYARPLEPPTGGSIASGAASTTLAFRLLNEHIDIGAFVNGEGPFTFIVDTGGHTLLSPHLSGNRTSRYGESRFVRRGRENRLDCIQ